MLQSLPLRSRLALVLVVVLFGAATQGLRWWSNERVAAVVAASARPGDIRMIASENCIYCAEARRWFEAHRVAYSECLVEREANCAAQYSALMTPGTPLVVVRGTPLRGFDARAIADALASHAL
jgi:glutaredoxin